MEWNGKGSLKIGKGDFQAAFCAVAWQLIINGVFTASSQ